MRAPPGASATTWPCAWCSHKGHDAFTIKEAEERVCEAARVKLAQVEAAMGEVEAAVECQAACEAGEHQAAGQTRLAAPGRPSITCSRSAAGSVSHLGRFCDPPDGKDCGSGQGGERNAGEQLYLKLRVSTLRDFEQSHDANLCDFEQTKEFKVKKTSTLREFRAVAAEVFGIPAARQAAD